MVELLRHRQTKGAETDMLDLTPPRHASTLPTCDGRRNRRHGSEAQTPLPSSSALWLEHGANRKIGAQMLGVGNYKVVAPLNHFGKVFLA